MWPRTHPHDDSSRIAIARLSQRPLAVDVMQHPETAHELERARIQIELLGVHNRGLDAPGHAASLGLPIPNGDMSHTAPECCRVHAPSCGYSSSAPRAVSCTPAPTI